MILLQSQASQHSSRAGEILLVDDLLDRANKE
jgi:hypothetical protein